MKLHGSLLVIVFCLVVEFSNISQKRYFFLATGLSDQVLFLGVQGFLFLLYPLLGHLTDVYLTRYRSLKLSYIALVLGICAALTYETFEIASPSYEWKSTSSYHKQTSVMLVTLFTLYIIGLGLFEANAIQFGLDQLLEASTSKLIAFIQWYYLAQRFARLVLFYVMASSVVLLHESESNVTINQMLNGKLANSIFIPLLIVLVVSVTIVLMKFCTTKKHFYIQRRGLNPFKNIYKVLKYSWKHKVPEHRSAFTYWEEDIPRRIDLGKNKYGGPFTNEEVEDTKTFLRLLPILLCLFGYHLAGDGYSAPDQLQRTSCPSLPVLLLIVINPLHLSTLVAVVGIPLYRLVIVKLFPRLKNVRMLTKMWIGLYLSLLQVVLYIIVVVNHDTTYWQQHRSQINETRSSPSGECYMIRTGCDCTCISAFYNLNCEQNSDPVDNTYFQCVLVTALSVRVSHSTISAC